ncbi:hypothetical protein GPJ56_009710 [Histomonas meleagridis]|uniref:uncharacterized protein n=1 Tax=Histomonas meleagridis TaxID=135588 RepID=UPI0035593BE9|nr:hypothetical protein GPJ56_009710 [Histomonas meleagridis]KAH0802272.1 hypothetical protein GO595_004885 [Histomonas meleagridis]
MCNCTCNLDSFTSLRNLDADLTNYEERWCKERTERTNKLRKLFFPNQVHIINHSSSLGTLTKELEQFEKQRIDTQNAINILSSHDSNAIDNLAKSLITLSSQKPCPLCQILKNEEFLHALSNSLTYDFLSADDLSLLIGALASIFPFCGNLQEDIINDGICIYLSNFIESDNVKILESCLYLIRSISSSSNYARDAILCMGLYSQLISIAKRQISEPMTIAACECLRIIFSFDDDADSQILTSCISPIIELLQIPLKPAIIQVIECLVEITNKVPSLVFVFFDLGIVGNIISLLDDPDIQGPALKLAGNMSVSQPQQIKEMLSYGLLDKLSKLFHTKYVSDTLWIISNLLESVPDSIAPIFNSNFVQQLIGLSNDCTFEIKKEISFLLATLIVFSSDEITFKMITPEVVGILVEMLGCGCINITMRCLDAIVDFIRVIISVQKFDLFDVFIEEGLRDRLEDLEDTSNENIAERANYITSQLNNYSN